MDRKGEHEPCDSLSLKFGSTGTLLPREECRQLANPIQDFWPVLQNALTRAEGQKLDPGYYCHMWSAFAGNKPILSGTVGAQLIGLSVLLLHIHPLDLTDKPNKTNQHRKTHERPNSTLH